MGPQFSLIRREDRHGGEEGWRGERDEQRGGRGDDGVDRWVGVADGRMDESRK